MSKNVPTANSLTYIFNINPLGLIPLYLFVTLKQTQKQYRYIIHNTQIHIKQQLENIHNTFLLYSTAILLTKILPQYLSQNIEKSKHKNKQT